MIVMEGVFLDRTDQGLTPRFVKAEPPSDADVANVIQQISRRVIRTLRRLGYLEAGIEVPVATGYDPLLDYEPALARTLAASVTQRIAFGERAGEKVRRIGSGVGDEGEHPKRTGPRCASVNGFSLHANTEIPAHRRDQVERLMRYTARGALSLERLEQDANGELMYRVNRPWSEAPPASNSRHWNSWRSWRHEYPCRMPTWCATAAVWRRIASCGPRSFATSSPQAGATASMWPPGMPSTRPTTAAQRKLFLGGVRRSSMG